MVERLRVVLSHHERESITLSEDASRVAGIVLRSDLASRSAVPVKSRRVVVGCTESFFMFCAMELQTSGVHFSIRI